MPRSMASMASTSGAGVETNFGSVWVRICEDGWAKLVRTRSVSMKPKYAQPTRAPVGAVSARRLSVSASTPAFEAE